MISSGPFVAAAFSGGCATVSDEYEVEGVITDSERTTDDMNELSP